MRVRVTQSPHHHHRNVRKATAAALDANSDTPIVRDNPVALTLYTHTPIQPSLSLVAGTVPKHVIIIATTTSKTFADVDDDGSSTA